MIIYANFAVIVCIIIGCALVKFVMDLEIFKHIEINFVLCIVILIMMCVILKLWLEVIIK